MDLTSAANITTHHFNKLEVALSNFDSEHPFVNEALYTAVEPNDGLKEIINRRVKQVRTRLCLRMHNWSRKHLVFLTCRSLLRVM